MKTAFKLIRPTLILLVAVLMLFVVVIELDIYADNSNYKVWTMEELAEQSIDVKFSIRPGAMSFKISEESELGVDVPTWLYYGTVKHEIAHVWHKQVINQGKNWFASYYNNEIEQNYMKWKDCNNNVDCAIREYFEKYRDSRELSKQFIRDNPEYEASHPGGFDFGPCERLEDFAKRIEYLDDDGVIRYYYVKWHGTEHAEKDEDHDEPMYVYAECNPVEFYAEMVEAYMNGEHTPVYGVAYYPRTLYELRDMDNDLYNLIEFSWGRGFVNELEAEPD